MRRFEIAHWLAITRALVVSTCLMLLLAAGPGSAGAVSTAWSPAQAMSAPRAYAAGAVLQSGDVLVVGGENGSVFVPTAEIYSPIANTWRPAASMSLARASFTATLVSSGRVLVAGGAPGSALAEVYDPGADSWSPAGSMSSPRSGHVAVRLGNGKVLVAGGTDGGTYLASADLYDPTTNSWSSGGTMSMARVDATATALSNGRVLVAGGRDAAGATASADIYDPGTNTWSPAPAMSSARFAHVAVPLNLGALVLVAGGYDGTNALASAEIYNVAGNTWSPAAPMSTARTAAMAVPITNTTQALVIGGADNTHTSLASAEVYDLTANSWSPAGSMSAGRDHAVTVSSDVILVAGGEDTGTVLASADLYIAGTPGPTIVASAPGSVSVGDTFDVTFSTAGAVPYAYTGYQVAVTYNSLLVTVTGVEDRSKASGIFSSVGCQSPSTNSDLGGALAFPMRAMIFACQTFTAPSTKTGAVAVAHVHVDAGGVLDFHMLTPGGSFTTDTTNVEQVSAYTCGGQVCGPVIGAPAWDVVADTSDSDQDGYSDLQETSLGKNPNVYCAIMRADVNGDGAVNILDLAAVARFYLQAAPPAPPRYDQGPPPFDGMINLLDLSKIAAVYMQNVSASP